MMTGKQPHNSPEYVAFYDSTMPTRTTPPASTKDGKRFKLKGSRRRNVYIVTALVTLVLAGLVVDQSLQSDIFHRSGTASLFAAVVIAFVTTILSFGAAKL